MRKLTQGQMLRFWQKTWRNTDNAEWIWSPRNCLRDVFYAKNHRPDFYKTAIFNYKSSIKKMKEFGPLPLP